MPLSVLALFVCRSPIAAEHCIRGRVLDKEKVRQVQHAFEDAPQVRHLAPRAAQTAERLAQPHKIRRASTRALCAAHVRTKHRKVAWRGAGTSRAAAAAVTAATVTASAVSSALVIVLQ